MIAVVPAIANRSLLVLRRVPAVIAPTVIFPMFFVIAFSGAYGKLTLLPGFPVDDMIDWMLPMSITQGAAFAGTGAGFGTINDLQNGFFDRFLLAPIHRSSIVIGALLGAIVRALLPTTVVLAAGLAAGAHLRGGVLGLVMLYVAAIGAALISGGWALGLALRLRDQRAAPLMQVGIFLTVFLSTAQVPLEVMTGWLKGVARVNPTTQVLRMARQGFVGQVTWADSWPGLAVVAAGVVLLGLFALRGLRTLTD